MMPRGNMVRGSSALSSHIARLLLCEGGVHLYIGHRVNHLRLPVAFASHLYELCSHIELVRPTLP